MPSGTIDSGTRLIDYRNQLQKYMQETCNEVLI